MITGISAHMDSCWLSFRSRELCQFQNSLSLFFGSMDKIGGTRTSIARGMAYPKMHPVHMKRLFKLVDGNLHWNCTKLIPYWSYRSTVVQFYPQDQRSSIQTPAVYHLYCTSCIKHILFLANGRLSRHLDIFLILDLQTFPLIWSAPLKLVEPVSDATTRLCEFWTSGNFNSASIWLIGIGRQDVFYNCHGNWDAYWIGMDLGWFGCVCVLPRSVRVATNW